MNTAKPTGQPVREGSGMAPAAGGSAQAGSPAVPNSKSEELQNGALQKLLATVEMQSQQIERLVNANVEAQKMVGTLGDEVGRLRREQPAITPDMKRQFHEMMGDEDRSLEAVSLIAQTTANAVQARENRAVDAFFEARNGEGDSIGFDEFKWRALKLGVPLEEIQNADSAKRVLRQIMASRPLDVEAIKEAAREEGARKKEEEMVALMRERGVSGLILPSVSGQRQTAVSAIETPLTDAEEAERLAFVAMIGTRQLTREQIPEEKRLRYGIV